MAKSEPPPPDAERAFREWFGLEQQGNASRYEAFLAGWKAREREVEAELSEMLALLEVLSVCGNGEYRATDKAKRRARALLAAQPRGEGAERG